MNICFIGKYPPIQGGTCSQAYWMLRGLADRGHKVYVVTNSWEVEKDYRTSFSFEDLKEFKPKNVEVFSTNPFDRPKHIPFSNLYAEKLSNLALDVLDNYDCDLIDSWYLFPYVFSAFVTKSITKKPFILRHAGSDLHRLYSNDYLNAISRQIISNADRIITYKGNEEFFATLTQRDKIITNVRSAIDLKYFNPEVQPFTCDYIDFSKPIITFIGKPEAAKGVFKLLEAVTHLTSFDFTLLFVTSMSKSEPLRKYVEDKKISSFVKFIPFVPPWKVPSILKASICVVSPEADFPIAAHNTRVPSEAMCVGVCTIISDEIHAKHPYNLLEDNVETLIFNSKEPKSLEEKLLKVLKNPDKAKEIGKNARKRMEGIQDFDNYINNVEKVYEGVCKNG